MPDDDDNDDAQESRALAALLHRVVARDTAALETLYDQLAGRIFAQAARWLGSDVLAVEEAVEETFWQIWRQAPRLLDAEAGVQAALLHLAGAAARDIARQRGQPATASALAAATADSSSTRPSAGFPQPLDAPFNGQLA